MAIFSAGKDLLKDINPEFKQIDKIIENLVSYKKINEGVDISDLL